MPFLAIVLLIVVGAAFLALRQSYIRQRRDKARLTAQLAKTTQELRDSEQGRQIMFSANPYPMWVYDCETLHFLEVNDTAVRSYGYSREEFLAMTLVDIRPPDDTAAFMEAASERHNGYSTAGVWRHRRKDGSILFVEIMAFEYQRDGRPQELILAVDITDRHRMEEALQESQASLQALVDNAPFGIAQALVDEGRAKTMNPAMRELLGGYSAEEALQLRITDQVYAVPKERDRLLEVLRRNGRIEGWETSFRRRDGSTVPVRISGYLSGGNGKSEVFSPYVEDMTRQTTLEQQVRQVQKLEAVGRLAGGMAHDFNNILVVIKLSTELMLAQITPESPFSKPMLQILNAADRAAALTRQMLAFGRQQIMQARVINLNTVVTETAHMLRRVIGEDIELVTNLSDNLENSRLDPDQMTQVILNLAVNARDAMPKGGTLHVETATVDLDEVYAKEHPPVQPGRYVMLAVSDTGTGIDKSILPRIFDPFFTTKEVGKGTGLGLSIVYGIVKQSGGYVWVYSEPGHGTTFKLYFPATSAPVERPVLRSEITSRPSGQTVLVVEDESTIRSQVRDCLQQLGYRVLEADSGAAALKTCEDLQGKVDLVLTDLVMSGMGGHELASNLAERHPEIRVLFMSGYTEDSAARREILLKGSPFLQKPFSVADLSTAVHHALTQNVVRQ
jgi:two-component system cell cycle sensor histidine kinase/response regulator CckA